jgi:hypothetical protein
MSSLLYQLSYNLNIQQYILKADKGFAPIDTGHEPIMFLLHQSAKKINKIKKITKKITFLAPVGFEPTYVMMKTLCLNLLTMRPIS